MKWIDVNDYLPPIGVEVLCFRPETEDYIQAMSNKPLVLYARRSDGLFPGLYPVTHWLDMDMPPGWTADHAKKQHA